MTTLATRLSQIVIFGLGGQGILFVTKLLAGAATIEGQDVIVSETHGMSQRGGAVESHVKIGGFSGALVRRGRADATIAIDPSRIGAALSFLRPGGRCFASSPVPVDGVRVFDAAALAREIGASRAANIALVGFASAAAPELFPRRESILAAIDMFSPPKAVESNRQAFLKGMERV